MQNTPFNTEEINSLIRNRRSVFTSMFTGEKVSDGIVEQMIENANWAPTHALTEPWRFRVYTGSGLQKLADFQAGLYQEKAENNGSFNEKTYAKLKEKPLECSHIISIGMQRDPKARVPEEEEMASVACAVQNMYLTATAYGIGCYWGTGGVTYFPEAKEFFGLGNQDRLMGFLYIGMPAKVPSSGRRKPVEEKVQWVR